MPWLLKAGLELGCGGGTGSVSSYSGSSLPAGLMPEQKPLGPTCVTLSAGN